MTKYTHKKVAAELAAKVAAGDDEVSPEQRGELKELGEGIRSLGRRSAKQALELGGYLARAKAILPERQLGAWVKAICKFTPKCARNYIAVYEHLSAYEDRIVEAAIAPTTLFVLAYADQRNVEHVLSAFEAGEQLTVAQVKSMVGIATVGKAATDDALNAPGLAGLRRAAQLKVEQDAGQFSVLMTVILGNVEKALEPLAQNKAVVKKTLQDDVVHDCRHAHDLLNSIAAPLIPDVTAYMNWRAAKLPQGTVWRKVQDLLHRMGGAGNWPERAAFVSWLQDEVVPLLRFVVHGEAVAGVSEINEANDSETEGLIPFDQMPAKIQATVENALEIVSPEKRDELRSLIVFNPKPSKRQYKTLAA